MYLIESPHSLFKTFSAKQEGVALTSVRELCPPIFSEMYFDLSLSDMFGRLKPQ